MLVGPEGGEVGVAAHGVAEERGHVPQEADQRSVGKDQCLEREDQCPESKDQCTKSEDERPEREDQCPESQALGGEGASGVEERCGGAEM